jgi:chromate transport protein ChrA
MQVTKLLRFCLTPVIIAIIKKTVTNAGKNACEVGQNVGTIMCFSLTYFKVKK